MPTKLKAKDPKDASASKPKILIFGSYGVSKTWGALSFPKCYYIDTEGGAKEAEYTDRLKESGGVYLGPEDGSNSLAEITEQVKALVQEYHEYETLVIDSITKPWANEILLEGVRIEAAGNKNEFGIDKKPAIKHVKRLLSWIEKLDMNVILIAREKALWKDSKQVGVVADFWDSLNYELSMILNIVKRADERMAIVSKSRIRAFPDGDVFHWSRTAEVTDKTAVNEFVKRMGNRILTPPVYVAPATIEQVEEIDRLLSIIRIEDTEIQKWKLKANADSFSEFNTDQAAGIIAFLTKKLQ